MGKGKRKKKDLFSFAKINKDELIMVSGILVSAVILGLILGRRDENRAGV